MPTRMVVVRVPADLVDVIKIVGWSEANDGEPREAVLVQPLSACPED
jgi:hypothetical protein